MKNLSPERKKIAATFKKHIDQAVLELGQGYEVSLQGKFDKTPIEIKIEISSRDEIP